LTKRRDSFGFKSKNIKIQIFFYSRFVIDHSIYFYLTRVLKNLINRSYRAEIGWWEKKSLYKVNWRFELWKRSCKSTIKKNSCLKRFHTMLVRTHLSFFHGKSLWINQDLKIVSSYISFFMKFIIIKFIFSTKSSFFYNSPIKYHTFVSTSLVWKLF